jgi:hypothetical protein
VSFLVNKESKIGESAIEFGVQHGGTGGRGGRPGWNPDKTSMR